MPPITSLVTFEATARNMSFTRAAGELNVTQAAVSRQIRLLEDHLGVLLFRRIHRAVQLTAEGRTFHRAVTMGLEHILRTAEEIGKLRPDDTVTLSTTTAFANFWLMDRIDGFQNQFPEIQLHVVASDLAVDLISEAIDVAVRFVDGHWPGLETTFLFDDEILPVCSPEYLKSSPLLRSVEDLKDEKLIHLEEIAPSWMGWPRWFELQRIECPMRLPGLTVNSFTVAIRAALNGEGIALGWRRLIGHLIVQGSLVQPVGALVRPVGGYYLLVPDQREPSRGAAALRDWILDEAERADEF